MDELVPDEVPPDGRAAHLPRRTCLINCQLRLYSQQVGARDPKGVRPCGFAILLLSFSHEGDSMMKTALSLVVGLGILLIGLVSLQADDKVSDPVTLKGTVTCAKCDLKE